uniref:Uncharacterized protein n=1 Tax=Rhizophora mucronata TaxID=61149 RepID=A0A2P2NRI7_RHIMU
MNRQTRELNKRQRKSCCVSLLGAACTIFSNIDVWMTWETQLMVRLI